MSFDLAVWFPHERFSNDRAGKVYRGLCDGDLEPLQPHPAIDAFYRELTAKHPEIDDVPEERIDDKDLCPWSVAHDRSDRHLIMCSIWPKAEYVADLVKNLARRHGLAVFNPQEGQISYPDGSTEENRAWWRFW